MNLGRLTKPGNKKWTASTVSNILHVQSGFICFSSFEVIKKTLEGIYINNFESTNNETINLLFSSFKDVTIHYTDMTQDFNSNAVGFNYWRNLYFTKWIKKLFKIEEVTSIK